MKQKFSYLGLLNRILFQWFFIRLTKCTEKRIINADLKEVSLIPNRDIVLGFVGYIKIYQWYSLQFWVLPCTGWGNDFIYLNKGPRFIKCSKERLLHDIYISNNPIYNVSLNK